MSAARKFKTPLSFAKSYNSMKSAWNNNVRIYKDLVMTFDKQSASSFIRRDLFGAELPQINLLTNNATIQIMNNLYDTSKLGFVYKPTLFNPSEDVQNLFQTYSKYIHSKTLSTNTNFTVAVKQFIEDAYVLGFGAMLVLPKGTDLQFITLKPEHVEFGVDPATKIPNRFFITVEFQSTSADTWVFQEVFKTDAPDKLNHSEETIDSYKIGEDVEEYLYEEEWTIRTWYKKRPKKYSTKEGKAKFVTHKFPSMKDNSNWVYDRTGENFEFIREFGEGEYYYSYSCDDYELDYCPVIYTRFNVKSNEVIGLGRGLESMAMIEEIKNIYNHLREAAAYDINKTILTEQVNLQNYNGQVDTIKINERMSKPALVMHGNVDGSGSAITKIGALELSNNPTIAFALLNKLVTSLMQAFEINRLLVSNPVEMTATEVTVRADRDKRFIDLYVNEFRLTFDLVLRLLFRFYMKDFVSLVKTTLPKLGNAIPIDGSMLKKWKKHVFDEGVLEVQFLNNNSREVEQQKIADISSMLDLQIRSIQALTQLNIDPQKAVDMIAGSFGSLGITEINLFADVKSQQQQQQPPQAPPRSSILTDSFNNMR